MQAAARDAWADARAARRGDVATCQTVSADHDVDDARVVKELLMCARVAVACAVGMPCVSVCVCAHCLGQHFELCPNKS